MTEKDRMEIVFFLQDLLEELGCASFDIDEQSAVGEKIRDFISGHGEYAFMAKEKSEN